MLEVRGLSVAYGPVKVLHGIDLATGRPRWSFHASSPFGTSPIVVNGFAYIVSLSGDVYALKAQTGVPAWAGNLGDRLNDPQNQWNTHNSLAAAGNILFVPTSNHLLALDHPCSPDGQPLPLALPFTHAAAAEWRTWYGRFESDLEGRSPVTGSPCHINLRGT